MPVLKFRNLCVKVKFVTTRDITNIWKNTFEFLEWSQAHYIDPVERFKMRLYRTSWF